MLLSPSLQWLFLDLNSYFASVEQQENPSLRGRPVAVVPMETDHTCAIAASYEAKAYGVTTGTIIRDAKQMCPGLICVLARHDKYVEYHNRILEEVIRHTPINKVWSIDELSSRLPPSKRTPEKAVEVALNIKKGLHRALGPSIRCSIGIAPNTLLAKMASDMQKPDGLVVIRPEDLPAKILPLPLTDIPGVGDRMLIRLNRAGIKTMADLWNAAPKQARKIWGSVEGERFWYWLHGYDFDRPPTKKSMIGHSRMLDPQLRGADQARAMARRLLTKAVGRLRRAGLYAGLLAFSARMEDGRRWQGEIRLHPADDPFTFLELLDGLWGQMMAATPRGVRFKKLSVLLLSLQERGEITGDLFALPPAVDTKDIQKRASLAAALDKLHAKYQRETVTFGLPPKTLAGYVGTKIAFNRVPDQSEFWE